MPAQADYFRDLFSCPRSLSFALDLQEHLGFHCWAPSGKYELALSSKESKSSLPQSTGVDLQEKGQFFLYHFYCCREMNSPWHNSGTKIDCFCNTLYNRLECISLFFLNSSLTNGTLSNWVYHIILLLTFSPLSQSPSGAQTVLPAVAELLGPRIFFWHGHVPDLPVASAATRAVQSGSARLRTLSCWL